MTLVSFKPLSAQYEADNDVGRISSLHPTCRLRGGVHVDYHTYPVRALPRSLAVSH